MVATLAALAGLAFLANSILDEGDELQAVVDPAPQVRRKPDFRYAENLTRKRTEGLMGYSFGYVFQDHPPRAKPSSRDCTSACSGEPG